ncbi:hypothetical protein [Nonomuraea rubra]|uniref:hypothetical protein n=1 Tax=Nonomuraea rubra TaxID=46180 RepID=UPI0036D30E3F
MPHGDDLDQRFNELVAQIDAEQQRKMRAAAKKGAKESRRARGDELERLRREARREAAWEPGWEAPPPRRRMRRGWLAVAGMAAVLAAAGAVVSLRPDLLAPAGPVPEETMPVAAAPLPSQTGADTGPEDTSGGRSPAPRRRAGRRAPPVSSCRRPRRSAGCQKRTWPRGSRGPVTCWPRPTSTARRSWAASRRRS